MITYRSYRKFDDDIFKRDIAHAPFHVAEIFDDLDDKFWFYETLSNELLNSHAPLNERKPKPNPVPFMNSKYRKACHSKAMAHNKFFKWGRTNSLWEIFRKRRNQAAKIRAKSVKIYFDERCNNKHKQNSKHYWNAIKPFISDKTRCSSQCYSLKVGDDIVNDSQVVSIVFNQYFSTVASKIATDDYLTESENIGSIVDSYENHQSILLIRSRLPETSSFAFQETKQKVFNLLKNLDPKKAAGYDCFPPKILKLAAEEFAYPLTCMINDSIKSAKCPAQLKCAEVSPLYKAADPLIESNFRPVSVLSCVSKVYERIYYDQIYEYFMGILSSYLSAFRKKYGCHYVLIKLIEDWKSALDRGENAGSILMDLRKAFDCLPHRSLLTKLHAYGVSNESCELIKHYLIGRQQCVKIGIVKSDWCELRKGVPQGSILGPLLFNIFINYLFYFIEHLCTLYNYADDNSVSHSHQDMAELKLRLEMSADVDVEWFRNNNMQANPSKFQGIVIARGNDVATPVTFNIRDIDISVNENVKVLGIHIDNKLKFDKHISELCERARRHLNDISRVSKFLDEKCRISLYRSFIFSLLQYCLA